jgi:putative membrane protein
MRIARTALALAFSLPLAAPAFAEEAPAAAGAPNDAQIAMIVVVADQVDIDAGKLAQGHSKNPEVKKFAKQMVTDHTSVNKSATALAKKLKVKPEPSAASKDLKEGGDKNLESLKKLKGAEFDKAYVDHEVDYHVAVLDTIDKVLIPNAQNAELKALITQARPTFAAHLEHAKTIQASLGK